MDLKKRWTSLCKRWCNDSTLIDRHFKDINVAYNGAKRHYHNFDHLKHMFIEFDRSVKEVKDLESLQMAIFYHDIVYNVRKKNNEENSAEIAVKRLKALNFQESKLNVVKAMILATKTHTSSGDSDIDLLLDIDMSILGSDWVTYFQYCKAIRKEYGVYPEFTYRKGRREVLNQFLQMDNIFKTTGFISKYETQARSNIEKELELL